MLDATTWRHAGASAISAVNLYDGELRINRLAEGESERPEGVMLNVKLERKGYNRLWKWFGMSYASWLTMPRVMMHEMPDDWQNKMASLLEQWDKTWDSGEMPSPHVSARRGHKFTKWPGWLLNYRHPDREQIERLRSNDKA